MSRIINVKVSQRPKVVTTKFGKKTVCNFLNQDSNIPKDQREIVVWRPPNDDELMALKVGEQVKLLHDGKKYYVVDRSNGSNGNNENSSTQKPNDYIDLGDLDLPQPLSPEQKRALQMLIQERAALMRYCIDTMREEVLEKGGYEMHESSIRSLGVSLFIHVNKYIP